MKGSLAAGWMVTGGFLSAWAGAQFLDRLTNPKVLVAIEHRPIYTLRISTIAVQLDGGEGSLGRMMLDSAATRCADPWLAATISDFLSRNVEVVDRKRLESILSEHKLAASGLMNQATAAKIGQLVGAQVFVFLKLLGCTASVEENNKAIIIKGAMVTPPDYLVKLSLSGTIQAIDLTTGRVIAARNIQVVSSEVRKDNTKNVDALIPKAAENASAEVMKLFFPWTEQRQVVFYDDKDCNLKSAALLLRGGDLVGALELSEQNVETCRALSTKAKKALWRSLHNLGILLFANGRYSEAISKFQEAMSLGGEEVVAEAMAECRRAERAQKELEEYGARLEAERAQLAPSPSPAASKSPSQQGRSGGAAQRGASPSVEERLRRIDQMCKQGLLTKEECQQKRQEILRDL